MVIGVVLFYCGIQFVLIWLLYSGSFILGVGIALTFLSVVGYVKFFPPHVISFYVAGLTFAGFLLSSVYIVALLFDFKFSQVRPPISRLISGASLPASDGHRLYPALCLPDPPKKADPLAHQKRRRSARRVPEGAEHSAFSRLQRRRRLHRRRIALRRNDRKGVGQ